MKLSRKQTIAIDLLEDSTTKEVLFGGAAGGGKSYLGTYWVAKSALKYPDTRWLIGRSELKILKETTLVTLFKVFAEQGITTAHYRFNQQAGTITFLNKSVIILKDLFAYPSDPNFDSLGSLEITGAFLDECNQLTEKAKNIVRSRIRHRLDENGLIPKILMTCNPAKNWVYSEFYKPYKEGRIAEGRAFIQSLVTDNPAISQHYIENLKELPNEQKQRLLYGNWEYDDDPAALLTYDAILNLWNNNQVPEGDPAISCDVARYGRDKTVIMVWSGWRLKRIEAHGKTSLTEVRDHIERLRAKYQVPANRVVIDEDGVGGGVVDMIRGSVGFVNNSTPRDVRDSHGKLIEENYQNLKSQCYFRLADRVNKGQVFIDCEMDTDMRQTLIEELEQVKQKDMDRDRKRAVVGKEDIKELLGRSPDISDALMMRELLEMTHKRRLVVA